MSDPIDTSHSLAQPTLPEALLIEDVAIAGVKIISMFVPGGSELFAVVNDAVDVVKKDGPTIEVAVATFLGLATQLVGADKLRTMLDAQTITLANQAAELLGAAKFGPRE